MPTKAEIQYRLDKEGKMAFGKYYGDYFETLSTRYLNWIWHEVGHDKLKSFYPNFYKYLCDNYGRFTRGNLI